MSMSHVGYWVLIRSIKRITTKASRNDAAFAAACELRDIGWKEFTANPAMFFVECNADDGGWLKLFNR